MSSETAIKKLIKSLLSHSSTAFTRTPPQSDADAYRVRSFNLWWDKKKTDDLIALTEKILPTVVDLKARDQIYWWRYPLFWEIGRFEEAAADLMQLNRPDCAYQKQIGQPLALIRKRKFMHEGI